MAHLGDIETRAEALSELRRHAQVPSVFEAHSVFDVVRRTEGLELVERALDQPYRKDYDTVENPMKWPRRFDVSNWAMIGAYMGSARLGGAIGAFNSPGLDMLEDRSDLLVLWDLRVSLHARRRGIGSVLFRAIENWGRERKCRELKVETQNTNVAACRLYAQHGCVLKHANIGAYPGLPNEVQLLWSKRLDQQTVRQPQVTIQT